MGYILREDRRFAASGILGRRRIAVRSVGVKKSLVVGVILVFVAAACYAQTMVSEPEFSPMVTAMAASGGVGVANPQGFSSLFVNPAGLASAPSTFTVLGVSPATYFLPGSSVRPYLGELSTDPADALAGLSPTIAANGIGGNLTVGLGYTGKGIGIGLMDVTDVYADSTQATSQLADASNTLAFLVGLAVPLTSNLSLGGTLRPMLRVHAPSVPMVDLVDFANGTGGLSIPVFYGFGIGLDLGLLWNLSPFTIGLALRDIGGTQFYYSSGTLGSVLSSITSGKSLPYGTPVSSVYEVPMNVTMGLAYHPNLGRTASIVDPLFEVDYHYAIGQNAAGASPLLGLHAGADVRFLSLVDLRVGFNQGYLTFGAGLKMLFLRLDAAYFMRPGSLSGSAALPNAGLATSLTISF